MIPTLLNKMMREPYLRKGPPKTAGANNSAAATRRRFLLWGKRHRARPEDMVRTATLFTSLSIVEAFRRFISPRTHVHELIVAEAARAIH